MRTNSAARLALVAAVLLAAQSLPSTAQSTPDTARELRQYRDFAMVHEGNAAHGRELFNNEQKAACVKCHSVDGSSSKAGPDLFAIGDKFPRPELIQSILEPSAEIAVGYGTTLVETKEGEEFQGVLKDSTPEVLDLMGGDGKHVRILQRDIKTQRGSNVSLMPEGLHAAMSHEDFTDLIDYLITLKQPASALTSNRGMPVDIPELARPVEVRPLFPEELRFPHAYVHKPGDVRYGLVWFTQLPGSTNLFVVVHQTGTAWLMQQKETNWVKTLFLDISREVFSERGPNGLLGMAFHPQFRHNRKYYLKHQVFEDGQITTVVVERYASADLLTDSGQPSRRLWKVVGTTQDHTGGCIAFGPDGCLYIGMGDTGPQQDPQGHGQDLGTHLGKMLRIDVDHTDPGLEYAIPSDNPFRQRSGARPEIWASGLREPWRFTFDSLTGDLWIGDVGQDRVEEVDIARRGENLGWNVYEGFEFFSNRFRKEGETYVEPVFAYRRKFGNSVIGGYVYRGDNKSSFYGVYVCGDYTSRRIFGLAQRNRQLQAVLQIGICPQSIASFGQDEQGNLYVVGYEGMIYKLEFADADFRLASQDSSAAAH